MFVHLTIECIGKFIDFQFSYILLYILIYTITLEYAI